jgi:hypothetical protein
LYSPNQNEVAPAKQLRTSTEAQKQASIADVLADFGTQLNQVMACIQQLPRPLTRAATREEIEAGIKREVAAALSAREPTLLVKHPAALTACKAPGDLVRYFGGLQQAGGFIWRTSCCESAPAARLLDEDIMPSQAARHGIWDAMQDFKVLKSKKQHGYRNF